MNEVISKTFALLRFPLMVGVVMIHCDISDQLNPESQTQWAKDVMYFFSNVIGRFSVPMFFLISGYLFFRSGVLDKRVYISKLRSRLHTLLLPYLLWNLIAFLYFVIKHYPPLCYVFQGITEIEVSFANFLKSFWEFSFEGLGESKSMPIDFPLWYVRDLMIIVLLAPLLYKLIKAGIFAVIVLGIAWLVFDIEILGLEISGFFFFTLGGYLAINKVDMFKGFASKQIVILVLLLTTIVVAIDMITRGTFYHYFIHNISVLMGVATVCISTVCIIKLGKQIRWIDKLAPTTFLYMPCMDCLWLPCEKGYV